MCSRAQEDMELSPDFFSYFEALTPLLDTDTTLMCISSWNDHGQVRVYLFLRYCWSLRRWTAQVDGVSTSLTWRSCQYRCCELQPKTLCVMGCLQVQVWRQVLRIMQTPDMFMIPLPCLRCWRVKQACVTGQVCEGCLASVPLRLFPGPRVDAAE